MKTRVPVKDMLVHVTPKNGFRFAGYCSSDFLAFYEVNAWILNGDILLLIRLQKWRKKYEYDENFSMKCFRRCFSSAKLNSVQYSTASALTVVPFNPYRFWSLCNSRLSSKYPSSQVKSCLVFPVLCTDSIKWDAFEVVCILALVHSLRLEITRIRHCPIRLVAEAVGSTSVYHFLFKRFKVRF